MKHIVFFALSFAMGLTCLSDDDGVLIFSDDFSESGVFLERWTLTGTKNNISCTDGKARIPHGSIVWNGELPDEFIAEAEMTICPAWATRPESLSGPRRAGFVSDYGSFHVYAPGATAMLRNVPGTRGTVNTCNPIDGYEVGKKFKIKYVRKCLGAQMKYLFYVNDAFKGEYTAVRPEKQKRKDGTVGYKRLEISSFNIPSEVDSVKVWKISSENDSPNTVFNSSFEYTEDGIPTHFNILGDFDWFKYPAKDYDLVYLNRISVDKREKHSGRQSLRINLKGAAKGVDIRPSPGPINEGARGVFSVWLKSSVPGVKAGLKYGNFTTNFVIATEWARYEVEAPKLPAPRAQSPASFTIKDPANYDGVVWTDDWQIEYLTPESERKDGVLASPYRPNASDQDRFFARRKKPSRIAPHRTCPLTPAESALKVYKLKNGESLVLGRLDFYMSEPEAKFRIWNEEGKMEEVSLDITNLPCGTNAVSVKAHGRTWPAKVVKLPPRRNATQVNNFSRSIIHDGRPELLSALCSPIGRWLRRPAGRTDWPMLDFLSSKGFRHVHIAVWADRKNVEGGEKAIKYAEKLGMLVDLWTGEMNTGKDISEEECWRRLIQPNICAYQVMDEPELRYKSGEGLEILRAAHRRLPYSVVMYNSAGLLGVTRNFANLETDVLKLDSYLTNNHYGRTVDSVVSRVDNMAQARPGKPCWYFLVSDNMTLHYKDPSYAEQVAQSWGVICAGGTGISWYIGFPYLAPTWRAMVDVNRELQELAPAILSEELCGAASADVHTRYLRHQTRKHNGEWYIFSCNIDAEELEKVVFTMPEDAPQNGVVEVLYENRTLKLKNGVFRDSYAPHTRHIYRIKYDAQ